MSNETTETTLSTLADEAYNWFETAYRDEARRDETRYIRLKDGRPEWIHDLVHSAHGDFGPDDWRYECIRAALNAIDENEGDEDSHDFADSHVDVYTGARLEWLASNLNRMGYCDEAVSEGLVQADADIAERVGVGQYVEAQEVYGLVLEALQERLDDVESAELACPRCGSTSVTPPHGHHLAKCDSCHFAFDTMDDDDDDETEAPA